MKKQFILFVLIAINCLAKAQNIQLHCDFGRELYKDLESRPLFTSTVEMFKLDKWGSTFLFVDMDYTKNGINMAYWEIARELQFWKAPVSIHLEYNGGTLNVGSIQNAFLGGATYTWNNKTFSRGVSLSAMYKYIQQHTSPHNFQLTGTWYMHFVNKKLTFTGFADFWREKNPFGDFIFMTEPQLWLNLNQFKKVDDKFNLSIGTEVELTHNFGLRDGFYCIPTLAIKWSFD